MVRCVIIGSSGRIGSAIHRLIAKADTIVDLDRSPSATTTIVSDLLDDDTIKKCFDSADIVFHVAALQAPHLGALPDREVYRVNVEGTERVFRAAKRSGVRDIILTSTTSLYGYASPQPDRASWITEKTTPKPRTIYHRTKLNAEQIARENASSSLAVRIIRMSRCFPEPAPLMAAYRLHRGVDARDVATTHIAALGHREDHCSTYNISGRTPFSRDDCEELKVDAPSVIRRKAPALATLFAERG